MKRGLIDDYSLCVDVIVSFVFFYAILIIINCCLLRIPLIITHYANFFHSMQTKIFINIKIVQAFRHIQTFLIIVLCWTKLILRLVENKLFLWKMECRHTSISNVPALLENIFQQLSLENSINCLNYHEYIKSNPNILRGR